MHELTNSSYNAGEDAKAKGMASTWGKGMVGPSKWKDAECVNPALKGVKMVRTPWIICVHIDVSDNPTCLARYNRPARAYKRARRLSAM